MKRNELRRNYTCLDKLGKSNSPIHKASDSPAATLQLFSFLVYRGPDRCLGVFPRFLAKKRFLNRQEVWYSKNHRSNRAESLQCCKAASAPWDHPFGLGHKRAELEETICMEIITMLTMLNNSHSIR